jgi:hypothetical protein
MKEVKPVPEDAFNGILLDAINQTLSALSRTDRRKVFLYLEKELGIKKKDVPCRIPEFSYAIEKVLGTEAFNYKTKLLLEIQKKLDKKSAPKRFDCLIPELSFEDYILIKQLLFLLTQKHTDTLDSNVSRYRIETSVS